ncbi:hypothetical protein [Sediminitomix flava]|uniref:Uncharacterized protein n=1 Tax=Sediminitomix flava TaxID=379075 RepID=A0A315ZAY2_SEDFL|nr:hypothetical protein [Sediminitomix flava]PWJ42735.1 hypothetical protein BC781_102280 [Sediminitomix flava]
MMTKSYFKTVLTSVLIFISSFSLYAQQETVEQDNTPPSLAEQFEIMKKKSSNYKQNNKVYKVVEIGNLNTFWSAIKDTISKADTEIIAIQDDKNKITSELASVQGELDETNSKLEKSAYINVLGIDFLKETYVVINFVIIISLIVLLLVAIYKFKNSNKVASDARKEYQEVEQEFTSYKQRALEKEMKLKRELVTEVNKVEELKQKLASHK